MLNFETIIKWLTYIFSSTGAIFLLESIELKIEKSDISGSYYESALEYIEAPILDKDWQDFKENLKIKIDKVKIKSTLTPNLILPIICFISSDFKF